MGIFSEADRHPFFQAESDVVEEARGGSSAEPWLDQSRIFEYARSDGRSRRLFIRDEQLTA